MIYGVNQAKNGSEIYMRGILYGILYGTSGEIERREFYVLESVGRRNVHFC
jgi:hypothetical protein